jgi:hypothetical protein
MRNSLAFNLLIGILLIAWSATESFACSCNRTPNPPCRFYWQTPVIFEGTVIKFVSIENNPNGFENRKAKFRVESPYKGIGKKEIEIYTGDGGSDCGFPFQVGKRYLVYAYGENSYLSTNYCGRTRAIENAKEDFDYFAQLPSMKSGVMIYGSLKKYAFGYGEDEDFGLTKPIAGIPIKIKGKKSILLRTDKNGNFKVSDFPAGTYLIEPVLPKNLTLSVHTKTQTYDFFEIKSKECYEAKFYVDFEGKVKGRVLDEKGRGVKGIDTQLVSAEYKFKGKKDTAQLLEWNVSNESGRYSFEGIPPGRYFLGIGIGGASDVFGKNGRVFYPNTTDPKKATVITIVEGKRLPEFNLRLPRKPER